MSDDERLAAPLRSQSQAADPTFRAISLSPAPTSAASKICPRFELAGRTLAVAEDAGEFIRSVWLGSTRWRMSLPRGLETYIRISDVDLTTMDLDWRGPESVRSSLKGTEFVKRYFDDVAENIMIMSIRYWVKEIC